MFGADQNLAVVTLMTASNSEYTSFPRPDVNDRPDAPEMIERRWQAARRSGRAPRHRTTHRGRGIGGTRVDERNGRGIREELADGSAQWVRT